MISIQVVASIENEAAGTSYAVRRLAETLGERGVDSRIFSTGRPGEARSGNTLSRVFQTDQFNIFGSVLPSGALRAALDLAARQGAVIHGHGLWRMPNLYVGWAAVRHDAPLIVSPQGMLARAALQYSWWQKRAFWVLAQKRVLRRAVCLHANSEPEIEDIRAHGLTQPIALIPNGVDIPPTKNVTMPRDPNGKRQMRTVLQLGRIHPQKRIDRVIDAWARLERQYPDWQLRIVGPAEGTHRDELKRRAVALGLTRVSFEDPLFGAEKQAIYREADLFILATENENFGMVIAEALASGTAVIATKGAPWPGIMDHRCGWWIEHGVDPLAAALEEAMALPRVALDEMGARGREWMAANFSWGQVAADMEAVYRWCKGEGDRPACIVMER